MGGYENLIGQFNRRSDLVRARDQQKQASIAALLGSIGQGATAYMDQGKLKELADSMDQGAVGGSPPDSFTPNGEAPAASDFGTMETAMAGGAVKDEEGGSPIADAASAVGDAASSAGNAISSAIPPLPNVSPPPMRPAGSMNGMPFGTVAPQMPPPPSGMMAPPPAPPQALSRPAAAKPIAPPPMPQSRRPNYGALAGMSPAAMDRAKLMLGGYEKENAVSQREAAAAMRESGLTDRASQMDQRMRELEQMRSGDRRYGVDERVGATERGQDLNYDLGGRRIETTERGQDINKGLGEGRIQMGRDIAGLRDTTTRRGQDFTNENADADRVQQGEIATKKLAAQTKAQDALAATRNAAQTLKAEIFKWEQAQATGKADSAARDRIVSAWQPTLRAIEAEIADGLANGVSEDSDEMAALKAQAEEFKKLLQGATAPAANGDTEATKQKIRDLLK